MKLNEKIKFIFGKRHKPTSNSDIELLFDAFIDEEGSKLINKTKNITVPIEGRIGKFSCALAVVLHEGDKISYINTKGKIRIPKKYYGYYMDNLDDDKYSFREDRTIVREHEQGPYGVIDIKGNVVAPLKYDQMYPFKNGYAIVQKHLETNWGNYGFGYAVMKSTFLSKQGKLLIPFEKGYDEVSNFCNGFARVMHREKISSERFDENWGYIDVNGNEVIPCKEVIPSKSNFTETYDVHEGFASLVFENDQNKKVFAHLDIMKKELRIYENNLEGFHPSDYDQTIFRYSEGLAVIPHKKKLGYVDYDGKVVIPYKYKEAQCFKNGMAKVCLNNKWGYIDNNNKEKVPIEYDNIGEFKDGFALVVQGQPYVTGLEYWFIDKNGNEYLKGKYLSLEPLVNGYTIAKRDDGKFGCIDINENILLPFKYDQLSFL